MTMHYHAIAIVSLVFTGCAMPPLHEVQVSRPEVEPAPKAAVVKERGLAETRYELRGYRDATTPFLRHEAHAVYRQTRVPYPSVGRLETVSRETYPLVSEARLPASEELAAELATQRRITAELRAMQVALAETERGMKDQLASLVRQSAEVLKVKKELEDEKTRALATPAAPESAADAPAPAPMPAEAKS
jgi:hypothetical protein